MKSRIELLKEEKKLILEELKKLGEQYDGKIMALKVEYDKNKKPLREKYWEIHEELLKEEGVGMILLKPIIHILRVIQVFLILGLSHILLFLLRL